MLGLIPGADKDAQQKPLMRAYSIASPEWSEELEFYSIKVPNGALTSQLQHVEPGDKILLKTKPVGTLLLDALLPGERLWLFATGTGIAPFAAILRDPETYRKYDKIIVTHTCREVAELNYGKHLIHSMQHDDTLLELLGKDSLDKLVYYPNTTREHSTNTGRITTLIRNKTVFSDLSLPGISPATDRAMICGSKEFNIEMRSLLEGFDLQEGSRSDPKQFVLEKAFIE